MGGGGEEGEGVGGGGGWALYKWTKIRQKISTQKRSQ